MILANIKKQRKAVVLFVIFISFCFLFFSFSVLAADKGVDKALEGLNKSAGEGFLGKGTVDADSSNPGIIINLSDALGTVVGAGLAFIGVLFFILIIYGGLLWMTARGEEAQVKKAKDLIQAAVIGLIIVLAAYAITAYISQLLFS
ncbi:hypothetical protein DRH27_00720 [Candidatus Falkowbacteria bacterium]|nr:MAG: hypothetical protein DRH27_00720 [Candidatus Falkowbacteria bacterium]